MSKILLDQFGALLMQQVRDDAITLLDKTIEGEMIGQLGEPLHRYLQDLSPDSKEALHALAAMSVDVTLQFFLDFIQKDSSLDLVVTTSEINLSLKRISPVLSDELHTVDGWIFRFSNKRNFEQDIFGSSL